jgi:cold shock CspA family protein
MLMVTCYTWPCGIRAERGYQLPTGTVKRVPNVKNYGFIVAGSEAAQEEIFFHRSSVAGDQFDALEPGDRVSYDIAPDPQHRGKRRAINVRPAEPS